jgi:hypothetical protein
MVGLSEAADLSGEGAWRLDHILPPIAHPSGSWSSRLPIAFRMPLRDAGAAADHETAGGLLGDSLLEDGARVASCRQIASGS